MTKTIIINGNNIHDLSSFYEEINRVFMHNEDWKLGQSLDAFSDMMYGGYGEIKGSEKINLIWKNFDQNKEDLGLEMTRDFYRNKFKSPPVFNTDLIRTRLKELEEGSGKTYFEILLEIITEHPNIILIPK